jgi:hypothetical protein
MLGTMIVIIMWCGGKMWCTWGCQGVHTQIRIFIHVLYPARPPISTAALGCSATTALGGLHYALTMGHRNSNQCRSLYLDIPLHDDRKVYNIIT